MPSHTDLLGHVVGVWGAMEQKTDLRISSGNLSSLAASRKV